MPQSTYTQEQFEEVLKLIDFKLEQVAKHAQIVLDDKKLVHLRLDIERSLTERLNGLEGEYLEKLNDLKLTVQSVESAVELLRLDLKSCQNLMTK